MSINKECPHCHHVDATVQGLPTVGMYAVVCNHCKAAGPPKATESDAVAGWVNTRPVHRSWADDDPIGGTILAAEITLDHLAADMVKGFILACCYDDDGHMANILTQGSQDGIDQMLMAMNMFDYHNGDDTKAPGKNPLSKAAVDIIAERRRQIEVEGWTPESDDKHTFGQIGDAAASYAVSSPTRSKWLHHGASLWPWGGNGKLKDDRSNLVRAGALIIAEIERLDRAEAKKAQP